MTILEFLQKQNKTISFPCNGRKQCGKCQVKILNHDQIEINEYDMKFISEKRLNDGFRLACAHNYNEKLEIEIDEKKPEILSESHILGEIDYFTEKELFGLITDIGSTTIVSKLIYLNDGAEIGTEADLNPQVKFGADVISRIKYTDENGKNELVSQVRNVIGNQYRRLLKNNSIDETLVDISIITGNTVMIHLFNDMDVSSIGRVPFTVPESGLVKDSLKNLFKLNSNANCYTLPHVSAFVGSDIVSGAIACNMDNSTELNLLLDMGTNGEIIIIGPNVNICTSTAAGPAFEGGNIECGGPSIEGAIYRVDYDSKNNCFNHKTIFNKTANSLCGSGLISVISEGLRNGLIDDTGAIVSGGGRIHITNDVYITSKDIREFQLAKAAIQTGVRKMLEQVENQDLSSIYISGGFGTVLSFEDLVTIGIIPRRLMSNMKSVKNTALAGAKVAALSRDFNRFLKVAVESQNLNLAEEPDFNDALVEALFFEEA